MTSTTKRFKNPVIPGFNPDPSICRVGNDFYLVTSSFEYFPGVPLYHSRDLVHWRLTGYVLTRDSQLDLRKSKSSGGIYAPTLRHDGQRFYMVTTHIDGGGNFYVTAERPEGPWSDPVWLDRDGFDPSFSFIDGTAYYTRDGKGSDFDHPLIYQGTLDPKAQKLRVKPEPIWPGTGGVWPEAPHLYKRGEYFYLMHAEGGTAYDHSEIMVRSRSPFGPFEVCPHGPILGHRARKDHPIQATGHADLVDLPNGDTWAVFLAIRPKSGRHHHLGRETFLAPVTWTKDGWPTIGNRGHVELEMSGPALEPAPFPRTARARRLRRSGARAQLELRAQPEPRRLVAPRARRASAPRRLEGVARRRRKPRARRAPPGALRVSRPNASRFRAQPARTRKPVSPCARTKTFTRPWRSRAARPGERPRCAPEFSANRRSERARPSTRAPSSSR